MLGNNGLKEQGKGSSSFQDDKKKNGEKDDSSKGTPYKLYPINESALTSDSVDDLNEFLDYTSKGNLLSHQFALIDSKGACSSCGDASASQCSLQCLFCKSIFHAVCKDAMRGDRKGNDVICARSFYNSFSNANSNSRRPHNFLFACDACITQGEHYNLATLESKVDIIDKRVNNLSKSIDEVKDLLSKVVALPVPSYFHSY
jgi:hypothetical protein